VTDHHAVYEHLIKRAHSYKPSTNPNDNDALALSASVAQVLSSSTTSTRPALALWAHPKIDEHKRGDDWTVRLERPPRLDVWCRSGRNLC
jgi:hypothetical protein